MVQSLTQSNLRHWAHNSALRPSVQAHSTFSEGCVLLAKTVVGAMQQGLDAPWRRAPCSGMPASWQSQFCPRQ